MSLFDFFLWQLRGTIVLALGYALVSAGFRGLRIESPAVRLVAVAVVLLAALVPISLPVNVAWHPPVEDVTAKVDVEDMLFVASDAETARRASPDEDRQRSTDITNTTPTASTAGRTWPHVGHPARLLTPIVFAW